MESAISGQPIAVSIGHAANLVGVSKTTIRLFVRDGRLQAARIGRRVVVPLHALRQLVHDSTIMPTKKQLDNEEAQNAA